MKLFVVVVVLTMLTDVDGHLSPHGHDHEEGDDSMDYAQMAAFAEYDDSYGPSNNGYQDSAIGGGFFAQENDNSTMEEQELKKEFYERFVQTSQVFQAIIMFRSYAYSTDGLIPSDVLQSLGAQAYMCLMAVETDEQRLKCYRKYVNYLVPRMKKTFNRFVKKIVHTMKTNITQPRVKEAVERMIEGLKTGAAFRMDDLHGPAFMVLTVENATLAEMEELIEYRPFNLMLELLNDGFLLDTKRRDMNADGQLNILYKNWLEHKNTTNVDPTGSCCSTCGPAGCYCQQGFYRFDGKCISGEKCPIC